MITATPSAAAPRVFVSYSHDSQEHKDWVLTLAGRLVEDGVDVILDQWDVRLGADLPRFMETGLTESDRVLAICTTKYVAKANAGSGGVGYEKMILTAQLMQDVTTDRVVPVVRDNGPPVVMPTFLSSRVYIDFRNEAAFKAQYAELLHDLHGVQVSPRPPLGPNPFRRRRAPARKSEDTSASGIYRVELGRRHRWLREQILKLDVRRMANFYGYERASQLEGYEAGADEFPADSIQRLTRFFFVNDAYLRGVSPSVFQSLLLDDSAAVGRLLDEGFRMYFLCCPERRHDLLTFPVLHKKEEGLSRSLKLFPLSSLSNEAGGGAMNVHGLITVLLAHRVLRHQVLVLTARLDAWRRLEADTFYLEDWMPGAFGTDRDGAVNFQRWFDNAAAHRTELP